MRRLKHPITSIREPFGTAGLIVAVVALVFAMLGGAYAASGNGGGKATASAKGKKGKQGKPGKTGAPGATGPAGPAGPAGAKGDNGAPGTNGAAGTPGANGKSVVLSTLTAGQEGCAAGGTKVEVEGTPASKKAVCNGKDGTTGFTDTLPPGKTETGTFALVNHYDSGSAASEEQFIAISFPIPLAAPGEAFFLNKQETEEELGEHGCTGSVANPTAPEGVLCLYTSEEVSEGYEAPIPFFNGALGYQAPGTVFRIFSEGSTPSQIALSGAWAVTAPEP